MRVEITPFWWHGLDCHRLIHVLSPFTLELKKHTHNSAELDQASNGED